jgi:cytochrome oxidase Cu insertion factor (SCO1/SenC/PrrC family)
MAGRPGRRRKMAVDPLDEVMEENLLLQVSETALDPEDDTDDRVAEVGEAEDAGRFKLLGDEDLYPDADS